MGTTVWIDDETRAQLRRLQDTFGTPSVNATLQRLLAQPAMGAHAIFQQPRKAIAAILKRHGLHGVDEGAFREDRVLVRATERLLIILGEAAKQLSDEARAAIDQPWGKIIRFRDRRVHVYESLEASTLFRIAAQSVPALAAAVRAYLRAGKHA